MSTLLLACDVMREEILQIPAPPTMQQEFLPMGLHARPLKLQAAIADVLAKARGFERIVLGFGLCGNALDSVHSPQAPLSVQGNGHFEFCRMFSPTSILDPGTSLR